MKRYGTKWEPSPGLRWLDRLACWYLRRRSRYGSFVHTKSYGLDLECPSILFRGESRPSRRSER